MVWTDPLVGLSCMGDDGAGEIGRKPFLKPFEREQAQVAARHIDHASCVFKLWHRREVVRLGVMARREDHVGRAGAIGQRAGNCGGGGESSRDAGDNFEIDAGLAERRHLLRGAAEDERVAALQAHHAAACKGMLRHQRVDFFLGDGFGAATLADVDDLGAATSEVKDRLRDKIVVEDDVGIPDETSGLYGEQVGITGTGANEIDLSCFNQTRLGKRRHWTISGTDDAQFGGAGLCALRRADVLRESRGEVRQSF